MELLNTSLTQITQQLPQATAVLNRFNLSFCCGGKLTLKEALEQQNLPQKIVLDELNLLTIQEQISDWSEASDRALIDHILSRYHQVHRQQLTELVRLAHRVESVHAKHPLCPNRLASHLTEMKLELEEHMQKEEQILFPMLLSGRNHMANGPIHVMQLEHEDHAIAINQIEQLTNGLNIPEGACNTWRALYLGLHELIKDLRNHISLENDILFSRNLAPSTTAPESGELAHG